MKKRNLVKIFAITLCLNIILSTIVMAKENAQLKSVKTSISAVYPHPTEDDFPD